MSVEFLTFYVLTQFAFNLRILLHATHPVPILSIERVLWRKRLIVAAYSARDNKKKDGTSQLAYPRPYHDANRMSQ